MKEYLQPTEFLNYDDESVREYAERNSVGAATNKEKAVKLYYAVRDGFQYNPNILDLRREGLQASDLLKRNRGYCVEKADLLGAGSTGSPRAWTRPTRDCRSSSTSFETPPSRSCSSAATSRTRSKIFESAWPGSKRRPDPQPRPSTLTHGPAVYGNDWSKWTCATYHSVTSSPSSASSPT